MLYGFFLCIGERSVHVKQADQLIPSNLPGSTILCFYKCNAYLIGQAILAGKQRIVFGFATDFIKFQSRILTIECRLNRTIRQTTNNF